MTLSESPEICEAANPRGFPVFFGGLSLSLGGEFIRYAEARDPGIITIFDG